MPKRVILCLCASVAEAIFSTFVSDSVLPYSWASNCFIPAWKGLHFLPNHSKTAQRGQLLCLCCFPFTNSGLKCPLKTWETQIHSCLPAWPDVFLGHRLACKSTVMCNLKVPFLLASTLWMSSVGRSVSTSCSGIWHCCSSWPFLSGKRKRRA